MWRGLPVISLLLCLVPAPAMADSGVVRASAVDGPWRLTVFSEPTPLRAGFVDLSVLVQRTESDQPVLDATVSLMLEHPRADVTSILVEATREAASNRLLYSAEFELPEPGLWNVDAAAMRGDLVSRLAFQMNAGEPLPPVLQLWIWFVLPAVAIVLIVVNQWLQRTRLNRRRVVDP